MENINVVASYLHKKFKKQQSVEPRRNGANLDETRPTEEVNNRLIDNNKILVPKISTNCNETSSVNNLSSISHAATTSSNLCISFVVSNEPTNPLMSSNHTLLQTINNNNNNYIKNESDELEAPIKEEKSDDVLPPPDRNPNGKYVCTYCNLVCSKPSVLQKHIRAHTNERPYPCTSCGFSFKTRSNLYKHCRSRTHANRVMGNKAAVTPPAETTSTSLKSKPYKPRFHQRAAEFEPQGFDDDEEDKPDDDVLSHHINEIITKNSSFEQQKIDEPLNLSSKNRKRCLSEFATENGVQKSLIKELLLKNLCSDMQCPYCKMIFQTVTELELHKLRSCKCKPSNVKYTRSSSVNVASILTHNKNAFDTLPQLQNTIFPLNSPGPFLGKTRLVDGEKCKSFSFDDNIRLSSLTASASDLSPSYLLSPSPFERKMPVKLFGGEVKITHTSGETKSFKIDQPNEEKYETNDLSNNYSMDYNLSKKLSENRVIKSSLQSGGTVLTNRHSVSGSSGGGSKYLNQDVIRVYDNSAMSPSIDMNLVGRTKFTFEHNQQSPNVPEREALQLKSPSYKYPNINDFSQNAVKMLMPNIKQLNNMLPKPKFNQNNAQLLDDLYPPKDKLNFARKEKGFNPVNLMIDGKVVRYVPGIPGPAVPASPRKLSPIPKSVITENPSVSLNSPSKPSNITTMAKSSSVLTTTTSVLSFVGGNKKFARPNSLALKPTNASLKQHHGLTPTMWNQILISPETPRVAKKYEQHCLQGNYFSFLGLKSSTRPVYCTLNKTQPFYVPHFKKLSMYSEWRQQDTKTDKLYVSSYDSRQKGCKYTMAGKTEANLIIHSSYKFVVSELPLRLSSEEQKQTSIPGGYESLEDYTYIRGRGRGRYVCDQCGIRCKKPSMLKKHIRTHSNDRPYTCNHCNFSFKTKGNLTKHMKSKAHTKNYTASSSGSSTQQSGTQSEDSGSDDSGMDSSDESSTRQQEHEAAYGLLSLSQKTTQSTSSQLDHISTSPLSNRSTSPTLNNVRLTTEEIAHMSQRNYAKNKILDENNFSASITCNDLPMIDDDEPKESSRCHLSAVLGISTANRPLTYPYITTILQIENDTSSIQSTPEKSLSTDASTSDSTSEPKCIKQFHVIQKYAMEQTIEKTPQPESVPITTKNDVPIMTLVQSSNINRPSTIVSAKSALPTLKLNGVIIDNVSESRKRKMAEDYEYYKMKVQKGDVQAETNDEVMDLSMTTVEQEPKPVINGTNYQHPFEPTKEPLEILNQANESNGLADEPATIYVGQSPPHERIGSPKSFEFDNSAMETLADVATKQVKLEKNTLAKSVASEFLKLAIDGVRESGNRFSHHVNQDVNVNDLIVKPEGNKSCTVCLKSFSKMSQLRLHMNIHYLERPFRCDSCSVSFRTKGHLQKHERSASHHSKLSSSPALSSSEPRPFKCTDCSIAFRIHGHLHKHLRSKVHIMKLECLGKIPFGLYAELERSNSLLTEINTCDGDQCLNSLKALAKKVFINDPNRLNHIGVTEHVDVDS